MWQHRGMQKFTEETNGAQDMFTLLYTDLRRQAQRQLNRLPPGQTLQATALVHEAYERLVNQGHSQWEDTSQFLAMAVTAMHDILVEIVRRKCSLKRGGDKVRVTLSDGDEKLTLVEDDLRLLSEALLKLRKVYPELATIVLLRFFGGCTMKEISDLCEVSMRTLERQWRFARSWLQEELKVG